MQRSNLGGNISASGSGQQQSNPSKISLANVFAKAKAVNPNNNSNQGNNSNRCNSSNSYNQFLAVELVQILQAASTAVNRDFKGWALKRQRKTKNLPSWRKLNLTQWESCVAWSAISEESEMMGSLKLGFQITLIYPRAFDNPKNKRHRRSKASMMFWRMTANFQLIQMSRFSLLDSFSMQMIWTYSSIKCLVQALIMDKASLVCKPMTSSRFLQLRLLMMWLNIYWLAMCINILQLRSRRRKFQISKQQTQTWKRIRLFVINSLKSWHRCKACLQIREPDTIEWSP